MQNNMKEFMKKVYIKTVLYLCLILQSAALGAALGPQIFDVYSQMFFHRTYVANITTPTYGNKVKAALEEFNQMADNDIIEFGTKLNGRPVEIHEMDSFIEGVFPDMLGYATPDYKSCKIYLRRDLDELQLREVVIHEYLHCMGYMHTHDRKDLMYYSYNPIDKEENIRQYAKEVKRKFYEPRFYRF